MASVTASRVLGRGRAAGPGQANPVEERGGRANARQAVEPLDRVHQGTHRADAAPAVRAVPRVAVQAAAAAGAQVSLDVVREMPLRPLVVIGAAGHADQVVAGSKASEQELMQYRSPVSVGPSLKTWPR